MTDSGDEIYARDIAKQIQEDINRQTGVEEAITNDEQRLRVIEGELKRIGGRLDQNREYRRILSIHLPYRIRAHTLLCKDMGLDEPTFHQPRAESKESRPGHRAVGENTWDNITSGIEKDRSPIGDQVERDTLASRNPVPRETEEYLMRRPDDDEGKKK